MSKEFIYLDYAAATPLDPRVLKAMEPYFIKDFYNPSAPYAPAVQVRQDFRDAKHLIAQSIGAKTDELIMTAGATESINLAIESFSGHIVSSNIEHQAVLESLKNKNHTLVKASASGRILAQKVKEAITPDTVLVSIGLANNELGVVQPIKEIAEIIRSVRLERKKNDNKLPLYLHSDASQGLGQLDINIARLGVDLLTLNASKIYGPKQVGLLYVKSSVQLTPIIHGGGQERGLRSGTENVPGVIGFARAIELAQSHYKHESRRLLGLKTKMQLAITSKLPQTVVSGNPKHQLSSHLHVSFPNIDGERLVFALENKGVLVATGSACAANKGTRSHVLEAIGLEPSVADGSLRLSLGKYSTPSNTLKAVSIIVAEVKKEYKRIKR